MSTRGYKPEQVVNILRQIEVEIANGKTTPPRPAVPIPPAAHEFPALGSPELPESSRPEVGGFGLPITDVFGQPTLFSLILWR